MSPPDPSAPFPPPAVVLLLPPAPVVVIEVVVLVPPSLFLDGVDVAVAALHPASAMAKKPETLKPRSAMCRVFMMLWPF
jgi:hypothetical protein